MAVHKGVRIHTLHSGSDRLGESVPESAGRRTAVAFVSAVTAADAKAVADETPVAEPLTEPVAQTDSRAAAVRSSRRRFVVRGRDLRRRRSGASREVDADVGRRLPQ